MSGEKRDNSGALFKAKASDNPNWPQYDGNCVIDGREYWLSAWVKEGKSGKFFSLSFKPKEKQAPKPDQRPTQDADDSIPF